MYLISEIFDSIQGEGLGIGRPATFIRAAGCNLACPHCDTHWIPEEWTEEDLTWRLDAAQDHIVLTGGEPLMQEGLTELCVNACQEGITIETNGTFPRPQHYQHRRGITWSVSPKLPWFCPGYEVDYDVLSTFNEVWGTLQWKFVVRNAWDIEDALNIVADLSPTEGTVILQPPNFKQAGSNRTAYLDLLRHLSLHVLTLREYSWPIRILPQLHILEGLK